MAPSPTFFGMPREFRDLVYDHLFEVTKDLNDILMHPTEDRLSIVNASARVTTSAMIFVSRQFSVEYRSRIKLNTFLKIHYDRATSGFIYTGPMPMVRFFRPKVRLTVAHLEIKAMARCRGPHLSKNNGMTDCYTASSGGLYGFGLRSLQHLLRDLASLESLELHLYGAPDLVDLTKPRCYDTMINNCPALKNHIQSLQRVEFYVGSMSSTSWGNFGGLNDPAWVMKETKLFATWTPGGGLVKTHAVVGSAEPDLTAANFALSVR